MIKNVRVFFINVLFIPELLSAGECFIFLLLIKHWKALFIPGLILYFYQLILAMELYAFW